MVEPKKFIMLLLFWAGLSFANTNDEIKHYQADGARLASGISKESIETFKTQSLQAQYAHKTLIDTFLQGATNGLPSKQKPQGAIGAILFVSFSMPDSLLFGLSDEAAKFHIPVVINGLVDGDFKKTIETFKRLQSEAEKQHLHFNGVSIDPVWFSQFHIKSVPALVVAEPSKFNQPFDVVYGNASIKKGLELIARKGDAASKLAGSILENGNV